MGIPFKKNLGLLYSSTFTIRYFWCLCSFLFRFLCYRICLPFKHLYSLSHKTENKYNYRYSFKTWACVWICWTVCMTALSFNLFSCVRISYPLVINRLLGSLIYLSLLEFSVCSWFDLATNTCTCTKCTTE